MKVKLLTPIASATGAFNAGDNYDCVSAEEANRMVEAGIAELIRSAPPEKAVRRAKTEKATR